MKPFVLALRAVGTEFVMRLYIPAVIIAGSIITLLAAGVVWLTRYDAWWWLFMIPVVVLFCIALGIATVVLLLIRYVRPSQTKDQKRAVKRFVDKIQNVSEVVGTPKAIILFRVVRSIAAPSKDTYLSELVSNRALLTDFRELQQSFGTDNVIL